MCEFVKRVSSNGVVCVCVCVCGLGGGGSVSVDVMYIRYMGVRIRFEDHYMYF